MLTQILRPFSWDEVVGQKGIVREMKKRSKDLSFPEVMLFEGASGTGKSTMAFIVAALLSDKNPIVHKDGTKDPNPESPSSKAILDMKFNRDVIYKDASNMSKEDVLALSREISNAPMFEDVKVVVIDECFHENTLVTTRSGKKRIADIKEGEEVLTSNGFYPVRKVFKNSILPERLCLVRINGKEILTTVDHLFMTKEGWKEAGQLKTGTELFNMEVKQDGKIISRNLQTMWETLHGKEESEVLLNSVCKEGTDYSSCGEDMPRMWREVCNNYKDEEQENLFKEMCRCSRSTEENRSREAFLRGGKTENQESLGNRPSLSGYKEGDKLKDEREKSNEQPCICTEDDGDSGEKWDSSSVEGNTRRKWTTDRASEKADGDIRGGLDSGVCNPNKDKKGGRISNLLQGRFGTSGEESSNRDRREKSQREGKESLGYEEDTAFRIPRVESVEVYKRGSNDQLFRGYFSDYELSGVTVPMYDLEVEEVHNYVVNDILVHNCQELGKASKGATLTLLEKKRKNTYLILCTMDVDKLDKAIRSRATTYNFKSPTSSEIAEMLMTYTDENHLNLPLDDSMMEFYQKGIFTLAENCEGSVRMALQNFERCVEGEFFTLEEIEKEFNIISTDKLNELIMDLVNRKAEVIKEIKTFGAKDFYYKMMKILGDAYLFSRTGYIDQPWKKILAQKLSESIDLYKTIEELQKSELNGYFREDLFFTSLTRAFFDANKVPQGITPASGSSESPKHTGRRMISG